MFKQDIFFVKTTFKTIWDDLGTPEHARDPRVADDVQIIFLATTKIGEDVLNIVLGETERTPFESCEVLSHVTSARAASVILSRLYADEFDEVTVHMTDEPFREVMFAAEQMKRDHDEELFIARTTAYFGPKFDAAIKARDKREITRLIHMFPLRVEKAFIMDRLRYGGDSFPELRKEGVTLDNWFDVNIDD
jgi:hypothetical protein